MTGKKKVMIKAYVFPGQGSQFPGMGKSLYSGDSDARALMEAANDILSFRITDIMFDGDEEALKATDVTQPAVFIHSVAAAFKYLKDAESHAGQYAAQHPGQNPAPYPDMVGGHSLGEFSALVVCGAVSFESALKLVAVRAGAMKKCCDANPGTMAAIIGLPASQIEEICSGIPGTVVPANYNCENQIVISGEVDAVNAACEKLKEAGARRALVLPVGGAFHSPLMESARQELSKAIESTEFRAPKCPIYQNVCAEPQTDPSQIKKNLLLQLTSPVKWTQTVQAMLRDGACEFVEFGPGKVLQGLISRTASGREGITVSGVS